VVSNVPGMHLSLGNYRLPLQKEDNVYEILTELATTNSAAAVTSDMIKSNKRKGKRKMKA